MRILYITNDFPYPLTSGHLRHYFLVRELARAHQVTLLSIVRPTHTAEDRAALASHTEGVHTFVSSTQGRSRGEKLRNQLTALIERRPVDRAALELAATVAELARAAPFDAAVLSGRRTLPVLATLGRIPVIADLCDADSVRLRGTMRRAGIARLPRLLLEYGRTLRAESTLLRRASHLLFASQRDLEALADGAAARATVVPNGVDADYWQRSAARGAGTIIFTGAMHYPPNEDAARWLIEEVLPLVRRDRPDARLLIVGRDPSPRLLRAGREAGVTVTGTVPDVRPWLEQASVFAAPLRFGAGIQNKVLEALAMELPVVASPLAADGLRREDGTTAPLTVAAGAEATARALVQELASCDRDPSPFRQGREHVLRYYAWRRSGRALERVVQNVARRETVGRGPALWS